MADARLEIILNARDNTSGAFGSAKSGLTSLGSATATAGVGLATLATAGIAVAAAAGTALVAGLGAAANTAANFEAGMSAVKAATGATAAQMAQLSAAAIALGADTQLAGISASDAATAMAELGKGGVTVEQQLGGATKGALLLASAGMIPVGEAAAIATKAMNIFGLTGADVAHVADLLAAGANKSATDVHALGAAFNQSAAVAKNAGLSIEELTGTLAFLAQRGIEGSDAGTSLKTALLALQAPTDVAAATMADLGINVRDANGQMLPFAQVADVLKSRLSGLSDAQRDAALKTIFGNDAIRVGIALYEGGGAAIRDWTTQVDDAGSAARTGATLNDNLKGSVAQLQAVFETMSIQIGSQFTPYLKTATDAVATFFTTFMANEEVKAQLAEWKQAASEFGTAFAAAFNDVKTIALPALHDLAVELVVVKELFAEPVASVLWAGAIQQLRDLNTLLEYYIVLTGGTLPNAVKVGQAASDGLGTSIGQAAVEIDRATAAAIAAAGALGVIEDRLERGAGAASRMGGGMAGAAGAIGNSLPAVTSLSRGLGDVAQSADATSASLGSVARNLPAVATNFSTAAIGADGITSALDRARNAALAYNDVLAGLGTEQGILQSQLRPLQEAWDELNKVTDNGTNVTSAQSAEYARLAPAIEYLNGKIGANKSATVDATLAAVGLSSGLVTQAIQTTASANAQSIAASFALKHAGAADTAGAAMAGAAVQASVLSLAIAAIPKSFTVTAIVDISQAIQQINTLANNMPHSPAKEGPFKTLPNWAALFESWGPALADAITMFESFGSDAAKKGADVASTVAKAITDALGALRSLGSLKLSSLPSGGQSSGFLASLADFMEKFSTLAGDFDADVLESAGKFADAAGKATGLVKNAVEGLTAIGKFTAPLESAISAFLASMADFMEKFSTVAGGFEADTLTDATAFADAAAKVGGSVGSALKGLQDLAGADWAKSSPTGSAMSWFTHLIASLVENFRRASELFDAQGLADASAFADSAGKVGGAVKNALEGLQSLASADWAKSSPSGSSMAWFTHLVQSLVENFRVAAQMFTTEGLAQATAFADAASKVLGIIGNGVTGLLALNTFVAPSKLAIDNFLAAALYVVQRFGDVATTLSTDGIAKTTAFATAAGQALGATKTGVDAFLAFKGLVIPSKEAIDNLMNGMQYVILRMQDMATAVGVDGLKRAEDFAVSAGKIFATVKAGIDLLSSLKTYKDLPAKAIDELLKGFKLLFERMGELQGQANAFEQQADTFLTTMQSAAQKIAKGLALNGAAPSIGADIRIDSSGGGRGDYGTSGGANVTNVTVTGNTLLSESPTLAKQLADLITPAQSRMTSYSY